VAFTVLDVLSIFPLSPREDSGFSFVLVVPVISLLFAIGLTSSPRKYPSLHSRYYDGVANLVSYYILCRLMLVVLPLLSLRPRPPGAHLVGPGRSFLPHR
jgi:hypothetical protein